MPAAVLVRRPGQTVWRNPPGCAILGVMRIYLDNCCYNRPYDDQSYLNVSLETQAIIREPFDYTKWRTDLFDGMDLECLAQLHGVRSLTPEAETVTGFEARFAVNERLRKRLGAMTAAVTAVVDPAPQISLIENPVA